MSAIPVSAVVLTKNEERNLPKCLRSLARFAEVFVVDSHSTDGTAEIARALGATLVPYSWDGGYPKKKQWCLENLPFSHDWVLYVDADEEVSPDLAEEIAALMAAGPRHAGYFMGLEYVFLGRPLRHGHRVLKLALFDRRRGRFLDYPDLDAVNMWEVEGHYQPAVEGPAGTVRGRLRHEDHDSLYRYFERHNRYSDWEAVLRGKGALSAAGEAQPGVRRWLKPLFHRMPFRSAAAFLYMYVVRLGFLDGRAGFEYAVAKSFYYWQVGVKLRELRARNGRAI